MKRLVVAVLLGAGFAAAGCLPTPSLYPVVEGGGIDVPELIGQWRDPGDSTNTLRFERDSAGACVLTLPRSESPVTRLDATFVRLGGHVFADLRVNIESLLGGDASPFVQPMHVIARVNLVADTLHIGPLDDEWLAGAVRTRRARARLDTVEGTLLLTEPPAGLRKLLARVANEDDAFLDMTLVRER